LSEAGDGLFEEDADAVDTAAALQAQLHVSGAAAPRAKRVVDEAVVSDVFVPRIGVGCVFSSPNVAVRL
jgi:hypothetical protein